MWLELSTSVQAFHVAGDERQYFGDEAVGNGQPVVDASGDLVTVDGGNGTRVVVLWTTNPGHPGIAAGTHRFTRTSRGTQILHRRGEPVYVADTAAELGWRIDQFAGGEARMRLGNEARRWFGGEQAFHAANEVVESGQQFFRIDLRGALVAPILYRNVDDVVVVTGAGADHIAVRDTHAGETVIDTGAGDDTIDVHAVRGNTTVLAGAGADTRQHRQRPARHGARPAAGRRPGQHRPDRRRRHRRRRRRRRHAARRRSR